MIRNTFGNGYSKVLGGMKMDAKQILLSGGYTCVLTDGQRAFTSTDRGVKPLVRFLESGEIPAGVSAADKVVGRATAYLYVLLKVKAVYSQIISQPAVDVLRENGVQVAYDKLVPNIINRKGDGICPFEAAVMDISSPDLAYIAIRKKMTEMNIAL